MSSSIRLYVFIRINKLPAFVEIEFPKSETRLASRYRESIQDTKTLRPDREKQLWVVAFELPDSVLDLETNRSHGAFVLHFKTEDDAQRFKDDICRGSIGHPRQVIIKQYWDPEEAADLKRSLHVERNDRKVVIIQSDRAPEPPRGHAGHSSRSKRPDQG